MVQVGESGSRGRRSFFGSSDGDSGRRRRAAVLGRYDDLGRVKRVLGRHPAVVVEDVVEIERPDELEIAKIRETALNAHTGIFFRKQSTRPR